MKIPTSESFIQTSIQLFKAQQDYEVFLSDHCALPTEDPVGYEGGQEIWMGLYEASIAYTGLKAALSDSQITVRSLDAARPAIEILKRRHGFMNKYFRSVGYTAEAHGRFAGFLTPDLVMFDRDKNTHKEARLFDRDTFEPLIDLRISG